MLRINRQTDYAVRVILALSKKEEGKRVSTSEVGREMLIPPALLQRIVAELASGGFILTQAGRDGGITLAHSPKQITLLQIVEHFEGELYLSDCILKPGECPFELRCPVHCQWVRLKNMLRDEMSRTTFEQLVEEGRVLDADLTKNASPAPKSGSAPIKILFPTEIPA
ncbi:MAG: Rrf2 family transcriptional regulator [Anaerolineales bacterium]|jgi:Rrf2 family protein|uniref:RrF2 family transcriptional regulator n=1 Tax=Candidatus Villigracilis affinis TaxID=3140682 RepID=UPI001B6F1B0E|nr:Rrf2 family transcriptional regulator [Anaerolineales bacterium]MBK9603186.1 Rrf2 family transcriptional regulator [Anaerolineales bacterium]MBL0346343.1 Rrf2 family transcriptional regulator [Anaerolineales bacterium]MBP8047772.1 Rrf2 family transcriptional regulator [Anaerolineales bacterium]